MGVAIIVLILAGGFIYVAWPLLVGVIAGIWLWISGHDNLGVLIGLGGLVGQVFWATKVVDPGGSGGYSGSMSDKKKVYNKKGEVIGYQDRD
jgi:hypothetical protein